jgi:hypothetical protein
VLGCGNALGVRRPRTPCLQPCGAVRHRDPDLSFCPRSVIPSPACHSIPSLSFHPQPVIPSPACHSERSEESQRGTCLGVEPGDPSACGLRMTGLLMRRPASGEKYSRSPAADATDKGGQAEAGGDRRARSWEFGVRSSELGVRSSELGVRSSELGVRSAEFGVRSGEWGVGSAGVAGERRLPRSHQKTLHNSHC